MSSFDAAFLHGVADYSKGTSPTPEIPDWKNLQRRLSDVQDTLRKEWQSNDSVASDIKDIASDFDFDSSLEDFVIRANDKIDHLHQGIRDTSYDLDTNWDPDGMTRDQMVAFVENLKDHLQEYLPNSQQMREVAMGWYGYNVARFVEEYHPLGQAWLCYTHDDTYMGDLHDSKLGDLTIKACANGILRFTTQWVPGYLHFTSDNKIVMGEREGKGNIVIKVDEFKTYFEDWRRPTEEEIGLFDVLHPGANWSVFRYLRDYEGKNYISNKKIITTIPTNSLISVSTAL